MNGPYRTQTPISAPMSTYQLETALRNTEAEQLKWRSDVNTTLANHANVLAELREDIGALRIQVHEMGEVLEWIKHTHPEVIVQYYAVKDIAEAGK